MCEEFSAASDLISRARMETEILLTHMTSTLKEKPDSQTNSQNLICEDLLLLSLYF